MRHREPRLVVRPPAFAATELESDEADNAGYDGECRERHEESGRKHINEPLNPCR